MAYAVDADSNVAMPINAVEYAEWLLAAGLSISVPGSLFRCNEISNVSLADSIGARTATLVGASSGEIDVAGWATNGVSVPNAGSWWSYPGEDLSITPVSAFAVFDIRTLSVGDLLSLGGVSVASQTAVQLDAAGHIVAVRGAASAVSANVYTDVVAILAVVRPGASDFSVYVKTIGGTMETLTPAWSAPPGAAGGVFICNGWTNFTDAVTMRLEYWTGAPAEISPADAASFMELRLEGIPVEEEAPEEPASLGGIMTILLLAQRGGRRERQLIYGKKHPMRRR